MDNINVADGITRLSANAAPNSLLFESMWPIPQGVSMNSYLVRGEKTAIVDGLCGWDGIPEVLFGLLKERDVALESIDYVVMNHMEPDHAGWIEAFRAVRPEFKIVASERAKPLLTEYFGIDNEVIAVGDGDSLGLGGGRRLTFHAIPNVHWPETIATFDEQTGTLMPCDMFGGFGSVDADNPYDTQQSSEAMAGFDAEMMRYYANILGAFSHPVAKALEKVTKLDIQCIAPGHGLIWKKPQGVIDRYGRMSSYSKGPGRRKVTVIWSSMYGATEMAVKTLEDSLRSGGVAVDVHNVPESHISHILQSVWDSSGVAIGVPTYEYKMFPPMFAVLDEIFKKKVLNRKAFSFGSYGWSGGAQKELAELVEHSKCKWEFLEPVEFLGRPKSEDLAKIAARGAELADAVKAWAPA